MVSIIFTSASAAVVEGSRFSSRAGSIPQIRELWTMIPKEPIPKKELVYELIPLKESILNEESILCG